MAKPSSTRKVARVARTGGGRTARGQRSWFFPTLMIVVSILGVFLIGFSRAQRAPDLTRPRIGTDHWHSAIGFDICGTFAPALLTTAKTRSGSTATVTASSTPTPSPASPPASAPFSATSSTPWRSISPTRS